MLSSQPPRAQPVVLDPMALMLAPQDASHAQPHATLGHICLRPALPHQECAPRAQQARSQTPPTQKCVQHAGQARLLLLRAQQCAAFAQQATIKMLHQPPCVCYVLLDYLQAELGPASAWRVQQERTVQAQASARVRRAPLERIRMHPVHLNALTVLLEHMSTPLAQSSVSCAKQGRILTRTQARAV